MLKPLCIDLFCGLGGWSEGFLAEGYDCFGFDIERHDYGSGGYPGDLVLQDILTLHGSQFKDAAIIVASPPCQEYSYMAMPWSRAKGIAAEYRSGVRDVADLTRLFDACFRIQREACEAAGRHIPMVVENVRGAQPWVGRSAWNYGSFHLWGDVPALMPTTFRGYKSQGMNWSDQTKRGQDFTRIAGQYAMENKDATRRTLIVRALAEADSAMHRVGGSGSRKGASAQIAKIPLPLSRHIARVYNPCDILRS